MNTPELFDVPKSLSPRLVWIEEKGIKTYRSPGLCPDEAPWNCWSGDLETAIEKDSFGVGDTEDEAIVNWAKANGVRLWNEEGL